MIGEINLQAGPDFTVALGFGLGSSEAAHHAYGALQTDFEAITERYVTRWQEWQRSLRPLPDDVGGRDLYRISTATMRVHANKSTPGAVASLSVPWGEHRGDEDILQGAYHLVWPRDLVNHANGLLAAGETAHTKDIIDYLRNTQEDDGHWPQNMWVSGRAFWTGIQLDQTAQPILLADLMLREHVLSSAEQQRLWPMVLKGAQFLAQYGPATELDRWEEKDGYNAYTLATAIAALLTAAEWADTLGESPLAVGLRELADSWNERIEGWMYVRGTVLAARLGVDGYYARIFSKARVFRRAAAAARRRFGPTSAARRKRRANCRLKRWWLSMRSAWSALDFAVLTPADIEHRASDRRPAADQHRAGPPSGTAITAIDSASTRTVGHFRSPTRDGVARGRC